jgi:hypothetical protein
MVGDEPHASNSERAGVTDKERVSVLLAEYNTLRTEMMQRYTNLTSFFTMSITSGVTIVGIVSLNSFIHATILAGILVAALCVVIFIINRDFSRLAAQIQSLESRINAKSGEALLTWETAHGRPPETYMKHIRGLFVELFGRTPGRSGGGSDARESAMTESVSSDEPSAKADLAKDQWGNVIRAQIHFNEMIQRARQLTGTVAIATFGSASAFFATHPTTLVDLKVARLPPVHITTPLIALGLVFLLIGFLTDRLYYYRLLVGSVEVGEKLEQAYSLPAKLSTHLSTRVGRRHATVMIGSFYVVGAIVGVALIWFVNRAVVTSPLVCAALDRVR